MKPLRFHLAAEEELHEVRRYYEAEQSGLGDQWMEAAEAAAQYVQKEPRAWASHAFRDTPRPLEALSLLPRLH